MNYNKTFILSKTVKGKPAIQKGYSFWVLKSKINMMTLHERRRVPFVVSSISLPEPNHFRRYATSTNDIWMNIGDSSTWT